MEISYYLFNLEDYSRADGTCGVKKYIGTLCSIDALMRECEPRDYTEDVLNAIKQVHNGDDNVMYYAAYNLYRFAERLELITERKWETDGGIYIYEKPFSYPLKIKYDSAKYDGIVVESENKYLCCYRVDLIKPRYLDSSINEFVSFRKPFMGFPHMIYERYTNAFSNFLFVVDSTFDKRYYAKSDAVDRINSIKTPDLTGFFEDVFGKDI